MQSDLDIVVPPHHRARVTVKRILRADEIATALRDMLACMNGDRDPVVIADWGDMFVESHAKVTGAIDVHPLGVMAYRMLTGAEPAPGVMFVPGAPPDLARLMVRMLSPTPSARPNIHEVKQVIVSLIGARDESVLTPLPAPPAEKSDDELLVLEAPADDDLLTLE
jgi:hypothetical protein